MKDENTTWTDWKPGQVITGQGDKNVGLKKPIVEIHYSDVATVVWDHQPFGVIASQVAEMKDNGDLVFLTEKMSESLVVTRDELPGSGKYKLVIRARNNTGVGHWSAPAVIERDKFKVSPAAHPAPQPTPPTPLPAAPQPAPAVPPPQPLPTIPVPQPLHVRTIHQVTGLKVENGFLIWDPQADAERFEIARGGIFGKKSLGSVQGTNRWQISGLKPGISKVFVRAFLLGRDAGWSLPHEVVIEAPRTEIPPVVVEPMDWSWLRKSWNVTAAIIVILVILCVISAVVLFGAYGVKTAWNRLNAKPVAAAAPAVAAPIAVAQPSRHWPENYNADDDITLPAGTQDVTIPPGKDYQYEIPFHWTRPVPLIIAGDPSALDMAENGKALDPSFDPDRNTNVQSFRYRNRSSFPIVVQVTMIPPQGEISANAPY